MRLLTFLMVTSLFIGLGAQESGLKEFPSLGISFTIPNGWVGQENEMGYVMGSYSEPGILLAMTHQTSDLAQLRSEASAGVADQQGTQLILASDIATFDSDGIEAHYTGTISYQPARAFAVSLINPKGPGITLIYMTSTEMFKDAALDLVRSTARSFKFTKVKAQTVNNPGDPSNTNWNAKFQNARLTYMNSYYSSGGSYGGYSTGGGYSDQEIIDLCGQGYFKFRSSSSMSVDTGGAFANSNSRGKGAGSWKIVNRNILELTFHNGEVKQYVLTSQDGKTMLNGYRYYCTYGNVTDDGPDCF